MAVEDHIIRQTTLNFRFYQTDNKFTVPGKVERWFLNNAVKEIRVVCDNLVGTEEYLEIDELEINLGDITEGQFEKELNTIFRNALQKRIKANISAGQSLSREKRSGKGAGGALIEVLISFLERGHFSWKSSFASVAELEQKLLLVYNDNESPMPERLMSLILKAEVRQRLTYNFSGEFILWLIKRLSNQWSLKTDWLSAITELKTIQEKGKILSRFVSLISDANINDTEKEHTEKALDLNNEEQKNKMKEKPSPKEEQGLEDGIFISNAGVVLLHPFFFPLFSNLGLMNDNVFDDDRDREKAIWLLYYMVNGHLDLDESQVLLLKLICGMPINNPLMYSPELSQNEKWEVEIVIEHAIKYWEILKNTSVDSFRETFLKREGNIKIRDLFIEVNVEQKGVDMLIGQLPWALSIISFPWLDKKFHINWA